MCPEVEDGELPVFTAKFFSGPCDTNIFIGPFD